LEQADFIDKFPEKVRNLAEKYPEEEIDVWFFDEHRVGLKPILRKVWSETGNRPIAMGHHRYEWLYVYGFVQPKTGETIWYLIPRVNTQWLNIVFENFARDRQREGVKSRALVVEDNAGWHRSKKVELPDSIHIEYLPAYSPELQPAERLWTLVDEPLANEYFETIDDIESALVIRCNVLREMKAEIKKLTHYHWLSFL
jgi:transposase